MFLFKRKRNIYLSLCFVAVFVIVVLIHQLLHYTFHDLNYVNTQNTARPSWLQCEPNYQTKRNIFKELLLKWIAIAKEANVSYVLSAGSLLGQYRNKDIVPWDHDMDILVEDRHYKKLKNWETPRDFVQGKDDLIYFVQHPQYDGLSLNKMKRWNCMNKVVVGQPDSCSFIGPMGRLIKSKYYFDIFGLKVQDGFGFESYKKKYFPMSDLFPAKQCYFIDILTKCPNNSGNILKRFYTWLQPDRYCVNGKWTKSLIGQYMMSWWSGS